MGKKRTKKNELKPLGFEQKLVLKEIIFLEIYPPCTSKVKIREFHQNRGFKTLAAIDQRQAEGGATNQKYHGIHVAPTFFIEPQGTRRLQPGNI
ncbi:MAG TPA: hypothetical protein DCM07_23200 [Planctomycetaceae bacterium]|uniref:hypothetical protein n=1 Tax=Gimesia sp. TaxID=2024833 RepID=UPI000C609433|nr:hypothetical protein [Gimesia sp.]MAX35674.1 hypothetical protein [Gimesia sp.]HAH47709.1 hypothetical protein [Planctomycetaceae bacterium]HBL45999.1 hypothetical protein [Planctomycetaceae bacterium]